MVACISLCQEPQPPILVAQVHRHDRACHEPREPDPVSTIERVGITESRSPELREFAIMGNREADWGSRLKTAAPALRPKEPMKSLSSVVEGIPMRHTNTGTIRLTVRLRLA
jgi:hypothetical protein